MELRPIGHVESPLVDRDAAPKQGDEGSPEAWLVFYPDVAEGDSRPRRRDGDHPADMARSRPPRRADCASSRRPEQSRCTAYSARVPADRPNPIGLHRVEIVSIDGPWNTYFGCETCARANRRTVGERRKTTVN